MADPYGVDVQIEAAEGGAIPVQRLVEAVAWVLRQHQSAPGTGVSVVIVDDDTIRQLNRQFRGIDAPTDVLSFPAEAPPVPVAEPPYLGDLVVGLPAIRRQAEAEGHAWEDEMVLAVVHGTLHLLGYDHDTAAHQEQMWAVQAQALAALGVAIVVPTYEFGDEAAASSGEDESH